MWSHVGRAPHRDEGSRYFVGFGPIVVVDPARRDSNTVSKPFRWAACDIAGMTPVEEPGPDERDRAMYKQATWKVAVLFAGPGMNLAIAWC